MIAAFFASTDAMILLTGALVAASGALLGSFLVLRGSAMLTDAISHSIVFGIVVVWMATGLTSGPWVVLGAGAAGVLTVVLAEGLARTRLVAMDAAIGLTFPALFAAGVLLINLYARDIHIDADTVLLGEIGFVWLETTPLGGIEVPTAVVTLALMLALNAGFVILFWKELKIATFDAGLAAALGFAPGVLFHVLLGLTSATAVASFDAVGAVLFVAFVVVPPATALLLTNRLGVMVALATGLGIAATVAGFFLALLWDVSIGGMMAVMTGVGFAAALIGAPDQGLIARRLARRGDALGLACGTLVAHLNAHADGPRVDEENAVAALTDHLKWTRAQAAAVVLACLDRGLIRRDGGLLALTDLGRAEAQRLQGVATGGR